MTPGQSEPGSDGNEGVLRISQRSSITVASLSDCWVSYLGHSLGTDLSAEKQSVYSIVPANVAIPFFFFSICSYVVNDLIGCCNSFFFPLLYVRIEFSNWFINAILNAGVTSSSSFSWHMQSVPVIFYLFLSFRPFVWVLPLSPFDIAPEILIRKFGLMRFLLPNLV